MAWIYRLDADAYEIADDSTLTDPIVRLAVPTMRHLIAHERPVYWHLRAEEVVRVVAIADHGETSVDGVKVWSVWVQPVAADWLDFAEHISAGGAFGDPPEVHGLWLAGRSKRAALVANGQALMVGHLDDDDLALIDRWCDRVPQTDKTPRIGSLRVISADGDALARLRATNPRCSACGQPMVAGQRGTHHSCRPGDDRRCTCHSNPDYRQWVIDNVLAANPGATLPEPCDVHGGAA